MATTKYAIPTISGASDLNDGPTDINASLASIDSKMVGYSAGVIGSRPTSTVGSPGVAGRIYYATDTGQRFQDTGTSWVEIATIIRGRAVVGTNQTVSGVGPVDLATVGPSVTIDVPDLGGGEGLVEMHIRADITGSGGGGGIGKVSINGDGISGQTLIQKGTGGWTAVPSGPTAAVATGAGGWIIIPWPAGAAQTFKLQYGKVTSGDTVSFASRVLFVRAIS